MEERQDLYNLFQKALVDLAAKYPLGAMNYISTELKTIFNQIVSAEEKVNKLIVDQNVTVLEFKEELTQWYVLHRRAFERYLKTNPPVKQPQVEPAEPAVCPRKDVPKQDAVQEDPFCTVLVEAADAIAEQIQGEVSGIIGPEDLMEQIELAHNKMNEAWLKGKRGELTIDQFKDTVQEWYNLNLKAIEIQKKESKIEVNTNQMSLFG